MDSNQKACEFAERLINGANEDPGGVLNAAQAPRVAWVSSARPSDGVPISSRMSCDPGMLRDRNQLELKGD